MTTATLTSKGQITIPAAVRSSLGVATGDRVEFVEVSPGRYELIAATRSIMELQGMFGAPAAKPLSIEAMNDIIARQGAAPSDTPA
jgi:AbrB family looped-hinge helix DNA binding protein